MFDVEDHGESRIPAVIGAGKKVFLIPGEPDLVHLRREVLEGARAIEAATGAAPHWYRGATAEYDTQAVDEIGRMGYRIVGFSVNADAGATLGRGAIEERLRHVKAGDILIAPMNRSASDSAEGLAWALSQLLRQGFVSSGSIRSRSVLFPDPGSTGITRARFVSSQENTLRVEASMP